MAFPSVRSAIKTDGTTATTTPSVSLPATIGGADTILVVFRSAAAGAIGWPSADWNELIDAAPDASGDQVGIAWKKADGSEGGTSITLSSGNGKFAAVAYAISEATDPFRQAPQISTVAVGTTGEPNATTVTPTGGAKDYLWLTVYTMEGEQTGVTSYPTNYTGSQLFANSGTGGAVTTNVTIGSATRAANAASEDAGVWDVTGTLDDSSAYTIAFHPAEAIAAPLQAAFADPLPAVPRRSIPAVVGFVCAVPLALLSYVAPSTAPTPSVQWTTSRIVTQRPVTVPPSWTQSGLALGAANPFTNRSPLLPFRSAPTQPPTWLQVSPQAAPADPMPFASGEWRNPRSASTWRTPQTVARSSGDPAPDPPSGDPPFAQRDWPNPRAAVYPRTRLTFAGYYVPGREPFKARRMDVMIPVRPRIVSVGFTGQSLALASGPVASPFLGKVFEVTRRPSVANVGTTAGTPRALITAPPFLGSVSEVYRRPVPLGVGVVGSVPIALSVAPAAPPCLGSVSEVYRRPRVQNVGAAWSTPLALVTAPPFRGNTVDVYRARIPLAAGFAVPPSLALTVAPVAPPFLGRVSEVYRRPPVQNVGTATGTPLALVTAPPFRGVAGPLPVGKRAPLAGFIFTPPPVVTPITASADPIPARPRVPLVGFTGSTPLALTTAPPFLGVAVEVFVGRVKPHVGFTLAPSLALTDELAPPDVLAEADYIIRIRADVGTIRVRPDATTIRVRPGAGDSST